MVTILALTVLGSAPQVETGAQLVSRMLGELNKNNKADGTILLTVSDPAGSVKIRTDVAFEYPSKLAVWQNKQGSREATRGMVSDGKTFIYSCPRGLAQTPTGFLVEPVNTDGVIKTYRQMYSMGVDSLIDRSAPLDLLMGRTEDMQFLRYQWATLDDGGEGKVGEQPVRFVQGKYRAYGEAQISGEYQMAINPEGHLLRYIIMENFLVEGQNVTIKSQWDLTINYNVVPSAERFKLPTLGSN